MNTQHGSEGAAAEDEAGEEDEDDEDDENEWETDESDSEYEDSEASVDDKRRWVTGPTMVHQRCGLGATADLVRGDAVYVAGGYGGGTT